MSETYIILLTNVISVKLNKKIVLKLKEDKRQGKIAIFH